VIIDWGRAVCGDLAAAEWREWLCTNGIRGFVSGTVAGTLTRRYHGLLVAALKPPLGRTLVCPKVDETVEYEGLVLPLSANRWAGNAIDPHGYRTIERFTLEGTTPVWTYAVAHGPSPRPLRARLDRRDLRWRCAVSASRVRRAGVVRSRDLACLAAASSGMSVSPDPELSQTKRKDRRRMGGREPAGRHGQAAVICQGR